MIAMIRIEKESREAAVRVGKSPSARQRSRSPRDRESRTSNRDKGNEVSPLRQVKEEPPSSGEEERPENTSDKQLQRLAGGRESPERSEHESFSDSSSCDSFKY
ncbi:hypothetical protein COOONC_05113, partial [Cooperia oncophora]